MITDFHSHILPGVDDGSESLEQSLEMLRMEAEQGIGRIVATPHFYPRQEDPETFLRRRDQALAALRAAADPSLPELIPGAEVYYFPSISDCEQLPSLAMGSGRHILVEMPFTAWTADMYRELEAIYTKQSMVPVLAHLDRYYRRFGWDRVLRTLEQLPVRIQVNASFFRQRSTAGIALRMLRKGQIHALGSDCHNTTRRPPDMGCTIGVIEARLGLWALEALAEQADEML